MIHHLLVGVAGEFVVRKKLKENIFKEIFRLHTHIK